MKRWVLLALLPLSACQCGPDAGLPDAGPPPFDAGPDAGPPEPVSLIVNGRTYDQTSADLVHSHAANEVLFARGVGTNCSISELDAGPVSDDQSLVLNCDEGSLTVTVDAFDVVVDPIDPQVARTTGPETVDVNWATDTAETRLCDVVVIAPTGTESAQVTDADGAGQVAVVEATLFSDAGPVPNRVAVICPDDAEPARAAEGEVDVFLARVVEGLRVRSGTPNNEGGIVVDFGRDIDLTWHIDGANSCSVSDGTNDFDFDNDVDGSFERVPFGQTVFDTVATGSFGMGTCSAGGVDYFFSPALQSQDVSVRVDVSLDVRNGINPGDVELVVTSNPVANTSCTLTRNGTTISTQKTGSFNDFNGDLSADARNVYVYTCADTVLGAGSVQREVFAGDIAAANLAELDGVAGVTGAINLPLGSELSDDVIFNELQAVGGLLNISAQTSPNFTTIDLPNLRDVGGDLTISSNANLTSINAPLLLNVEGNFEVRNNPLLTALDVFPRDAGFCTRAGGEGTNFPCANINGTSFTVDGNTSLCQAFVDGATSGLALRVTAPNATPDFSPNKADTQGCPLD